jgi:cephalosporin hydroxylase
MDLRRLVDLIASRYFRWRPAPAGAPRSPHPPREPHRVATEAFHQAYYGAWTEGGGTIDLSWFGYRALKCPLDLWIYQEIIVETRPDLIIECGTRFGGSALFLACVCELLRHGRVISIDIETLPDRPSHRLIQYVTGSSTDPAVVARIRRDSRGRRAMVILDSDHAKPHVLREMELYHDLVAVGCYLVVEDTNVNGHPVLPDFGPGPAEAVEAFLAAHAEFVPDPARERFMMTLNPGGFLKRVR